MLHSADAGHSAPAVDIGNGQAEASSRPLTDADAVGMPGLQVGYRGCELVADPGMDFSLRGAGPADGGAQALAVPALSDARQDHAGNVTTLRRPAPDKIKIRLAPDADEVGNLYACAAMQPRPPWLRPGGHAGQRCVIVAPGPSLTTMLPGKGTTVLGEVVRMARRGWVVIAIKEALHLLESRGVRADYSVSMDPGPRQAVKTPLIDGVTYLLATTCHPTLFEHLRGRDVRLYHNFCGSSEWKMVPGFHDAEGRFGERDVEYEGIIEWQSADGGPASAVFPRKIAGYGDLVKRLFGQDGGGGLLAGAGLSVANRAVDLAKHMGCSRIAVAGAAFGWRDGQDFYAPGVQGQPGMGRDRWISDDRGVIDGRVWHTQPDMLASAVDMARLMKRGEITVIGDSLARSLAQHTDEFIAQFSLQ